MVQSIIKEVGKAISGKSEVTEKLLICLLAEGHALLDDVPGVGKTTLALAVSRATGLNMRRIQFTPDVLPGDIVGFSVYNRDSGLFEYRPGALNGANIVLGDEINRTSPKTQSALLEAMEEGQVTVDGNTYPLSRPFCVIATQNSVGSAGTQMLPYAQLERFMMRLTVGYPDLKAQIELLRERQNKNPLENVNPICTVSDIVRMQAEVRAVKAADAIIEYIAELSVRSRTDEMFETGISPRGALLIDRAAKAHAYVKGRSFVTGSDIQDIFIDVCAHRVILSRRAFNDGLTAKDALERLLKSVPVPDRRI